MQIAKAVQILAVAATAFACTRDIERFANNGAPVLGETTIAPNPARDGSTVAIAFSVQGDGLQACAVSIAGQSATCTRTDRCDCVFTIGTGTSHGLATVQLSASDTSGTTTASTTLVVGNFIFCEQCDFTGEGFNNEARDRVLDAVKKRWPESDQGRIALGNAQPLSANPQL